jgi:hypothetical protein
MKQMGDEQKGYRSYLAGHCAVIFRSDASLSPAYERPFSPLPAERCTVRYQERQNVSGKSYGFDAVNWEEDRWKSD